MLILAVPVGILVFILARLVLVWPLWAWNCKKQLMDPIKKNKTKGRDAAAVPVAIVLGSGGHTGEMLLLLASIPKHFWPRHYIVGHDDQRSATKISQLEMQHSNGVLGQDYFVHVIHRARKVGEPIPSSIVSTLRSTLDALLWIWAMRKSPPGLILCNGPAICVPIALAGYLSKAFYSLWARYQTRVVYIESLARVQSLSVTGKILYWFVDGFVVHWPACASTRTIGPWIKRPIVRFQDPII